MEIPNPAESHRQAGGIEEYNDSKVAERERDHYQANAQYMRPLEN